VLGLYFAQTRFYDSAARRFTQEDPVREGANWYAYCGNSPVGNVDVFGTSIASAISNAVKAVVNVAKTVAPAVTNVVTTIVTGVASAVTKTVQAVTTAVQSVASAIAPVVKSATAAIGAALDTKAATTAAASETNNSLKKKISDGLQAVTNKVKEKLGDIGDFLKKTYNSVQQCIQKIKEMPKPEPKPEPYSVDRDGVTYTYRADGTLYSTFEIIQKDVYSEKQSIEKVYLNYEETVQLRAYLYAEKDKIQSGQPTLLEDIVRNSASFGLAWAFPPVGTPLFVLGLLETIYAHDVGGQIKEIDDTIKMLNEIAIDDRKGITTETFTHYPQYGIDYWTVTYKAQ
jgi:hypothetical protein